MKTIKYLVLMVFALAIAVSSCKKTDDQPAYLYKSGGFIKGTIVGISEDGIALNETFSYDKFDDLTDAGYTVGTTSNYFSIYRSDPNNACYVHISFTRSSTGLITYPHFDMEFVKDLGGNRLLVYDPGNGATTVNISSVTFDSTTGKLTGNYTVAVKMSTSTGTERLSTIAGAFDVTVYQIQFK